MIHLSNRRILKSRVTHCQMCVEQKFVVVRYVIIFKKDITLKRKKQKIT